MIKTEIAKQLPPLPEKLQYDIAQISTHAVAAAQLRSSDKMSISFFLDTELST